MMVLDHGHERYDDVKRRCLDGLSRCMTEQKMSRSH